MTEEQANPTEFLKKLRRFMAEKREPQQKLDQVVAAIADNMKAEVCSLYILRSDSILELYASKGLNPEAVHSAGLKLGQGLVGNIAVTGRVLNLVDAQQHASFFYLPETGEEVYSSFLGVPILRAGKMLGVLTVQSRSRRSYSDEEIAALEIVAMLLADLIFAGDLPEIAPPGEPSPARRSRSFSLTGTALNDGVGLGYAVLHAPRIAVAEMFQEDNAAEKHKLVIALDSVRREIDAMLARGDMAQAGEHRDILEAYRMFAYDKGWVKRLEAAIESGLTAQAAVDKVQNDMRARMASSKNAYMRERLSDFDDLAHRLLAHLTGENQPPAILRESRSNIIIARFMGAAELLDYPRDKICALVLEDGADTSHVVIVARALGIPVIGQAKGIFSLVEDGEALIVDGDKGEIHVRPGATIEQAYAEKLRFLADRRKSYHALQNQPSRTVDNVAITLLMNAGLLVEIPHLAESGAEGIGLFRTELQFMIASAFPKAEAQEQLYRDVYRAGGDKAVTFRTLDIGGDKMLPYFRQKEREENPALGWRAVRLTLDRTALMRIQLRALLKASAGRSLRLMLPMVTELAEIAKTRRLIAHEKAHLQRFGYALPAQIKLGAMIEVPNLLFQLDGLMQAVDFVSVGSNDLFQYMMAADRGNSYVAARFDWFAPAFLRALAAITAAAARHETPVTLCGEMAGKPLAAMALIGLGYRRLSMSAAAIGPVKAMLLSLHEGEIAAFLREKLQHGGDEAGLRPALMEFARSRNIVV